MSSCLTSTNGLHDRTSFKPSLVVRRALQGPPPGYDWQQLPPPRSRSRFQFANSEDPADSVPPNAPPQPMQLEQPATADISRGLYKDPGAGRTAFGGLFSQSPFSSSASIPAVYQTFPGSCEWNAADCKDDHAVCALPHQASKSPAMHVLAVCSARCATCWTPDVFESRARGRLINHLCALQTDGNGTLPAGVLLLRELQAKGGVAPRNTAVVLGTNQPQHGMFQDPAILSAKPRTERGA